MDIWQSLIANQQQQAGGNVPMVSLFITMTGWEYVVTYSCSFFIFTNGLGNGYHCVGHIHTVSEQD